MTACVVLHGADRPFGAEIAASLADDGWPVLDAAAWASAARGAHAVIVNQPVARGDLRFDDITDPAFAQAVEDGVMALFDIVQAALPKLAEGGSLVVVASRAHLGGWGGAHIMAAGAALIGLCRTLAIELAEAGIRVNVVAPDFADQYQDDPAGRVRVAEAAAWLASDRAAGVTGEVTLLNAGRSLQMREARRR